MQTKCIQKEFVNTLKAKKYVTSMIWILNIDLLLLANVFDNLRKMSWKIYQLDSEKFPSGRRLAWQAIFKKAKVELKLLTDTDMLSMLGKGIAEGIYHSIIEKLTINVWRIMI